MKTVILTILKVNYDHECPIPTTRHLVLQDITSCYHHRQTHQWYSLPDDLAHCGSAVPPWRLCDLLRTWNGHSYQCSIWLQVLPVNHAKVLIALCHCTSINLLTI